MIFAIALSHASGWLEDMGSGEGDDADNVKGWLRMPANGVIQGGGGIGAAAHRIARCGR